MIAINWSKTLSCINLLEYFLLVSPPLNSVPIPSIRTIPTPTNNIIDNVLTNISVIIDILYDVLKIKKQILYTMTFCLESTLIKPENKEKIKSAVILLHGYGGDGKDIYQIQYLFVQTVMKHVQLIHLVINGSI